MTLQAVTKGRVLQPADTDFEPASKPWNVAVRQSVAAVVEATDADDVASVVRYARKEGLTVAVQPNGHGASGNADGVILLRTKQLQTLEVDADARTAKVGAGVNWGQAQAATEEHGLTGLPGSAPVVSVVGYTLGGGLGWFARKYGLAADSVRAFDLVDADGNQQHVTADSDADLFWALRGAGGDVAIVTAIEYDLRPAPGLYGGALAWPADKAADVLATFKEVTAQAPDELTLWYGRLEIPNGPPPMVAIQAAYLGDADAGQALLSPFDKLGDPLQDTRQARTLGELAEITNDPTDPSPGKGRTSMLTSLNDDVTETLLDGSLAPLLALQLRHTGGALAQAGPGAGPHGSITEPYLLYAFGLPLSPELAAGITTKLNDYSAKLGDNVTGRKPFTFLAGGESASAAFDQPTIERLRQIKRDRDPANVFRSNYPVLD